MPLRRQGARGTRGFPLRYRLAIPLLSLLAGHAVAGTIQGVCDARFFATSTLHDFSGTVRSRDFAAPVSRDAGGNPALPSVELEFPVADMRTGIDARDEQMRAMFQSDRHPLIRAVARDVDAGQLRERMRRDAAAKAPLEITLVVRGAERKVQATAGNWKEEGGTVSFDVEFPVSLREFGLKPPSVLGIIRVGDRVLVKGAVRVTVLERP